MGMADRVRRQQIKQEMEAAQSALTGDASRTGSPVSSSLAVPDSPHILRFRGIIRELVAYASREAGGYEHLSFLLTTFSDELAEELKEMDELSLRLYFFNIGEIISWVGHGDNERLPDFIRPFAEGIQPSGKMHADKDSESGAHIAIDSATG